MIIQVHLDTGSSDTWVNPSAEHTQLQNIQNTGEQLIVCYLCVIVLLATCVT